MPEIVPSPSKEFLVRTFYRFSPLSRGQVLNLQQKLLESGLKHELTGSILLSTEGCNGTIAGHPQGLESFFDVLTLDFPGLKGQDSWTSRSPFKKWKVQIREQIVAARDSQICPGGNFQDQKSPQEWDQIRLMAQAGQVQMIDVRNRYEVEIGTFPEAIDPGTETFKEFSDYLDRETGTGLDPKVPTAIFCTGGIRCEKARVELEARGFQTVWQLHGGILNYLKERPDAGFKGACFVFDERRAVDQWLRPLEPSLPSDQTPDSKGSPSGSECEGRLPRVPNGVG